MKLFIDTGNIKDIETLAQLGIHRRRHDQSVAARQGAGRLPAESEEDLRHRQRAGQRRGHGDRLCRHDPEGHDIAAIDAHMVVKVPLTRDGIRACKALSGEGIRVNVTLVFSPAQALLAAKAGATFVSPVCRPPRRCRDQRHGTDSRNRRHLRQLRVHHRSARGELPASDPRRRSRTDGRRHLHVSAGGDRSAVQPSAHHHRPREVPEGLGESRRRSRPDDRSSTTFSTI